MWSQRPRGRAKGVLRVTLGLEEKAGILVEALPYMQSFSGKTIVIKYGGSAMQEAELEAAFCRDVILLKYIGINVVLVHGGGLQISHYLRLLGQEPVFIDGLRVTDAKTMEIVQMVLVGKINKELVATINQNGGKAIGLSGADGNLITARKYQRETPGDPDSPQPSRDLGFVGEVAAINPGILEAVIDHGFIPVIAPIGSGPNGQAYNINADLVAGEVAVALKASKLIMLTDVEGIYREPGRCDTLISTLSLASAEEMLIEGAIQGGMKPKLEACTKAVANGVSASHIIDGRRRHALLLEIFTDEGIGTMVVPEA